MIATTTDTLNDTERKTLSDLTAIVHRGQEAFLEVATALLRIRDERLYREAGDTFEEFCQVEFGFSHRRANQLIDAAAVIAVFDSASGEKGTTGSQTTDTKPTTERQARALKSVPDEKKVEVWKEAEKSAPKDHKGKPKVTSAAVRVVAQRVAAADAPAQPETPTPEPTPPAAPVAPNPTPWIAYNAKIDRVVILMTEAAQVTDELAAASTDVTGIFGDWIKRKEMARFFSDAIAQYNGHKVTGWSNGPVKTSPGHNFLYACETGKRGKK